MTERFEVIQRALRHYVKRLEDLIGDKDNELKADIIKSDLITFAKETEDQLYHMKDPREDTYRRQLICIALTCYINDLNQSKNVVKSKLPDENRTFRHVEEEKRILTAVKDEICRS